MNQFNIKIAAFKPPFMKELMTRQYTVAKKRVSGKVVYFSHEWDNPKCARHTMYKDNSASIAERAPYNERFSQQLDRVFNKAVIRFNKHYAGINYQDEVVRTYAPYAIAPEATINVMSKKWLQHTADKKFLSSIVSRLTIKYNTMMCLAQQGKYSLIQDALYDVNKAYHELQSMCRPSHHEVVFKGKKNPLTANRR